MATNPEQKLKSGTPGRVAFTDGRGDLPMLEVRTDWGTAEVYLQGAQVTHFQVKDQPPLLFLSHHCSRCKREIRTAHAWPLPALVPRLPLTLALCYSPKRAAKR